MTTIYTIGHGRKEMALFVAQLKAAGVVRVVDIRLRPMSRFCPWARKSALEKILPEKYGLVYIHDLRMSATDEMLDGLKKKTMPWATYSRRFLALMRKRKLEAELSPEFFVVPTALMCSETLPAECHRRLVAEYLKAKWPEVRIVHLGTGKDVLNIDTDDSRA